MKSRLFVIIILFLFFSAFIAPLTAKLTFVTDEEIDESAFSIDPGKTTRGGDRGIILLNLEKVSDHWYSSRKYSESDSRINFNNSTFARAQVDKAITKNLKL